MKINDISKQKNNILSSFFLISLGIIASLLVYVCNNNDVFALSIAAVGDWGCTSQTDNTVKKILSGKPDIVLGLGDYSYETSADCWLKKVQPFYQGKSGKMKINIGNHEDSPKEDLNKYLSTFGMKKQYYSFDIKNVHFLVMATEVPYKSGSDQYKFVVSDLSKASTNKNVDWIVVIMHRIMYTSPTKCSSCPGIPDLRQAYHPIFDKYRVDLVLQGHAHDYQRTFPLQYNQKDSAKPIVTDKNINKYNDPSGSIFAIIGTGGINFHAINAKSPFVASQHDKRFGHLDIDISNSGLTKILNAKFVGNDGKIMDQFQILNQPRM